MREDSPLLRVSDIRTEYRTRQGAVQAVRGVSFDLRRGEKTAIVGESGSGKSALALSLIDLVPRPGQVTTGSVVYDGRDLRALSAREWNSVRGRAISLIYQDASAALDPVRTIGHQLRDAIRAHQPEISRQVARERATQLLRDVEIPSAERRSDDYPHQYSGGMRQRVMIAIALASDPAIVIADEPTTALDVTTQAQVFALLGRLVGERGSAVVLITHNLGVVAGFCDTVNVMYAGRIIERGPVEDLFAAPAHPYTRALLGAVPRPDRAQARLTTIPGLPPDLSSLPPGCPFAPRCALGRGREDCVTVDPQALPVTNGVHSTIVACHVAHEQGASWEPVSG